MVKMKVLLRPWEEGEGLVVGTTTGPGPRLVMAEIEVEMGAGGAEALCLAVETAAGTVFGEL